MQNILIPLSSAKAIANGRDGIKTRQGELVKMAKKALGIKGDAFVFDKVEQERRKEIFMSGAEFFKDKNISFNELYKGGIFITNLFAQNKDCIYFFAISSKMNAKAFMKMNELKLNILKERDERVMEIVMYNPITFEYDVSFFKCQKDCSVDLQPFHDAIARVQEMVRDYCVKGEEAFENDKLDLLLEPLEEIFNNEEELQSLNEQLKVLKTKKKVFEDKIKLSKKELDDIYLSKINEPVRNDFIEVNHKLQTKPTKDMILSFAKENEIDIPIIEKITKVEDWENIKFSKKQDKELKKIAERISVFYKFKKQ